MIYKLLTSGVVFIVLLNCSTTSQESTLPTLPSFDSEWDYSDPVITELKFLEILGDIDFDQAPAYHLELRTQIARTLGLQHKFDEAHALLDEVETDLDQSDYPIAKIRYLLERGRVFNSSGSPEKSKPFFNEAWELSKLSGADFYGVDAAHMLGIVEDPANQLVWNEKALNLAEASEDYRTRKWLGSLYNNIGWTYHNLGNFEKALEVFERAQRWQQMNRQVREIQIADWTVARAHRSLGNIDLALEMQLNLETEIIASGAEEDGYVYEEIAECLLLKNEPSAATEYFLKAWVILSQDPWLVKNEVDRLTRMRELSEVKP